jgi:hypothetical protein
MSKVHASIMAVLVQAALVTVAPGPEDNCPSSAQVQAALETHAPRLVTSRQEDVSANQLTLTLSPALATGEMSILLIDKAGLVKLYRLLPPPVGDRARDCAALADTVSFIVDRYFEEVEIPQLPERKPSPVPPPALPPVPLPPTQKSPEPKTGSPVFALSATAGRRIPGGVTDLGGYEFKLTGGAAVTNVVLAGGRPWLDVSAGIVGIANQAWSHTSGSGSAAAVRAGADFSLLLGWPIWNGWIYAGPQVSLEMVWLNWRDAYAPGQVQREILFDSAAGLRTSYQYLWKRRFFARADLVGCVATSRTRIATESGPDITQFESPPAYLTLAFGVGIWF